MGKHHSYKQKAELFGGMSIQSEYIISRPSCCLGPRGMLLKKMSLLHSLKYKL